MPSVYPGALDALTNPTAASPLTAPSHADQHIDANDCIEAVEATLGINPQGAYATIEARLAALSTTIARQELVTTQNITGTDTVLTDVLGFLPASNASVRLFLNGVFQQQGVGADYTVSGTAITWLALTGTAVDMTTGDILVAAYGVDGSGAPGGLDTQVQFNDGGGFGGDPNFVYNKTTDRLGVRTTPLSALDVGGSVGANVTSTAISLLLDDTHHTVLVDASGGPRTITLPAVAGCTRRRYEIKKTDSSANIVTVDGNGAETIDGSSSYTLAMQYKSVTIVCDGSTWHVV